MKVLIDTNVILDFVLNRMPFAVEADKKSNVSLNIIITPSFIVINNYSRRLFQSPRNHVLYFPSLKGIYVLVNQINKLDVKSCFKIIVLVTFRNTFI